MNHGAPQEPPRASPGGLRRSLRRSLTRALTWVATAPFRLYRNTLGLWLPDACRFTPSCSHYAEEAFATRGLIVGSALTLWRLLRCQPFSKGGFDPVPPRRKRNS